MNRIIKGSEKGKDIRPVIKSGRKKKDRYPKLAESRVSDGFGFDLNLELKDRRPALEPCINFISSGGRWFLFIPVGLWEDTKREVDKMMRRCNL